MRSIVPSPTFSQLDLSSVGVLIGLSSFFTVIYSQGAHTRFKVLYSNTQGVGAVVQDICLWVMSYFPGTCVEVMLAAYHAAKDIKRALTQSTFAWSVRVQVSFKFPYSTSQRVTLPGRERKSRDSVGDRAARCGGTVGLTAIAERTGVNAE